MLKVDKLSKHFPIKDGWFSRQHKVLKAVDEVSFSIAKGETLGLVGESGCGKSTLGRTILRLHEPTSGTVELDGGHVTGLDAKALYHRRREMQIIFQDPYASLNPRRTILDTLREPLDLHNIGDESERRARIEALIEVVGLRTHVLSRYPHEFSGGQRQRIGIARALTLQPKFIVADEAVSALDVSVQAQVLNLIKQLQDEFDISFLFISHDLAVVQHISHKVGVMYLGQLVELADADELFANPQHPYTRALMSAVPIPDPAQATLRTHLQGDVPSPLAMPDGCPFHTRCPDAMPQCKNERPVDVDTSASDRPHWVKCHLYTPEQAGIATSA
ncbi:MAG: ABC transporter ATP-binding protein [Oceanococcus sp.]